MFREAVSVIGVRVKRRSEIDNSDLHREGRITSVPISDRVRVLGSYLTANLFTAVRGTAMPALFWLGVDLERGPKMDTNFVDRLGRNFRRLTCRKTGIPAIEQELRDIEGFWKARHLRI